MKAYYIFYGSKDNNNNFAKLQTPVDSLPAAKLVLIDGIGQMKTK